MKILLPIFIMFASTLAFGQLDESSLKSHRTGTYQYAPDSGFDHFRIKRSKWKQIEYSLDKKEKLVFKVKWISENKYSLELVRLKNMSGCLKKGDILNVTITKSSNAGYSCFSISESCGNVSVSFVKL